MSKTEYIANLSPAQKQAVVNYKNHSMIVAGAGSGKTRVLTCRIANMIDCGVNSYSILALTFTNKAAKEMRERVESVVPREAVRGLAMGTFHSIFARILRQEASLMGYPSSFSIYDSNASKTLIKNIIKEMELAPEYYKPNGIASRISLAKNNLVVPSAYMASVQLLDEDRKHKIPEFSKIYATYCRKCKENGAMDYDDLLLNMNVLFRDSPEALARYQQRFKYILVDEYQDTNTAQYLIVKKLTEKGSILCVVGDDSQSIYSFRGAKIENILRFRNDFPNADIFKLEQNYRSTQTIVDAANSLIAKNKNRLKKTSFSQGDVGDKIKVLRAYTDKEEATIAVSEITRLVLRGNYNDAAILYRTNAQSRSIEEALRQRNIPYRIYGGHSFYERKEVMDFLAYVSLILNPNDDIAFRRIVNYPARGLGDTTVGRIAAAAASSGASMWSAAQGDLSQFGVKGAAQKKIMDFIAMINSFSVSALRDDAYNIASEIALRSGMVHALKTEGTPEAESALENIDELLSSVKSFMDDSQMDDFMTELEGDGTEYDSESLAGGGLSGNITIDKWYANVKLMTDADKQDDVGEKITLTTVHSVKGLEFDYVVMVGLEENLFPSMRSINDLSGLEEERRLFYVALTRAKKNAIITFARQRFMHGDVVCSRPSRFIAEIDSQYLDMDFALNESSDDDDIGEDRSSLGMWDSTGGGYRRQQQQYNNRYAPKSAASARPEWRKRSEQERIENNADSETSIRLNQAREALRNAERAVAEGRMKRVGVRPQGGEQTPAAPVNGGKLQVGTRVEHPKFGRGVIVTVEQMGGDLKLTINFGAEHGVRTLLNKFAKIQVTE
ncbi:MAG: 3'-5' exonuclease [Rikenellaceae bacterium]